jgi:hypothetical protein
MRICTGALLLLASSLFVACGADGEALANATVHHCELKRIERELAAQPQSQALQAEHRDRLALLDMVVETASDQGALRSALEDVACE